MIGERGGEEGRKRGEGKGGRGVGERGGAKVMIEVGEKQFTYFTSSRVPGRIIVAPSTSARSAWFSLAGTGSYVLLDGAVCAVSLID